MKLIIVACLKRLPVVWAVTLLFFGGWLALTPSAHADAPNCDDNAVIRCGVSSPADLDQQYQHNQGGNVQAVYSVFGIHNLSDLNGLVEGQITSSGQVMIGNVLVGTNAVTAGRQNIGHSTPILGGQFFERPPSVSFLEPSLKAFIKMQNNVFQFAVIESCGNPVTAIPTTQPPPPTPQPQPHPNFTILKEVSTDKMTWQKSVSTTPGQDVFFRTTISNTGDVSLTNIQFQDVLPEGLTFVPNSIQVNSSAMNGDLGGINLGSVIAGDQTVVIFQAKINQTANACQAPLVNTASATPQNLPKKSDTAQVFVCVPTKPTVVTTIVPQSPPSSPPAPPVTPTAAPTTTVLPNTGMGDVAGIFAATSIAGYITHRFGLSILHRLIRTL